MAEFCTIEDVEAFLLLDVELAQIVAVERAIQEASAAIQNYCHQRIEYVANDQITLDCAGGTQVLLPELPVISVSEVIEDGETLVSGTDYKLGQHGILHRIGANWASGVGVLIVTYTHGYATIPDDIAGVCARAAARAFQAGLRAEEVGGIPGVASTSLGDYSVSFGSEQSTGANEAMLGASAAPMLLRSEKEILNRYRVLA